MFQWYQWSSKPEWVVIGRKGDSLPHVDTDLEPGERLHAGDTTELPSAAQQDFKLLGFFLRRLDNVDRPMSAAELAKLIP